ncbi:unnamed protein product [Onchocerca ochengi]|uniref:C2H2-type domain-containing protein n=1 Tax=Onchocerca ochengi TaxID=42157 RepID=A0A182E7R1_ONCOC|nr:unnamed protein product [Onchocerca ochengi]
MIYFQELWCLASVDGVECKETFDTYDEFEEHFCQKHLDLALFACDAKGCTAQFGTILQIFRHLAVCKRQGKKIKLLQYSDDILESLATLDRAKLLAVQCCVKRAKRALESAEMNDDVTIDQDGQCSLDEMGFRSSSDDDQLHVPIIEPLGIRQVKNVESGSYASRSDRTVTAARQAAWRLKEQMLLEGRMKKNKPLEKPSRDTQKKQKKLPVKITDKTRISALINDDPKKVKGALGHLQTVKSDLSPDSALANMKETNRLGENMIKKQSHKIVNVIDMSGTVNSDMPFVSTKHIVSAESKPKSLLDKTQDPKQPKIFESSLPANPNHPPKIYDASHPQLSSGAIDTRPPDYSEFVRNPVINPTLREIPLSRFPIPPLQIPSVRSSNDCQNSSEINCPHTSTILASQSAMLPSSQVDVQQNRNIERHGILRTARIKNIFQSVNISCTEKSLQKKHGFQNMVGTVEETGQMDFDVLSLFSKRMQECKTLEHLKVSTTQAKELERPGEQTKSVKSNIKLEEEEPSKKFKSNTNLLDLSSDKDHERKEDVEYRETTPILLNLFSDNETTPVLFDPRIMPKSLNPDEPRNDRPNIEGEVIQEKKVGMCRDSNGYHGSSGNEKKR